MKPWEMQMCMDCDDVHAIATHCPACGSSVAMPLSRLIKGEREAEALALSRGRPPSLRLEDPSLWGAA